MIQELFRFGFVLLEQIAAFWLQLDVLAQDEDLKDVQTFKEYVEYKKCWLKRVRPAFPCTQTLVGKHTTRVLDTFPPNGFLTDAAKQLDIDLKGTVLLCITLPPDQLFYHPILFLRDVSSTCMLIFFHN
jgi:hypothetical protein